MNDEPIEDAPELARRATLTEHTFTSTAPGVGGLIARLRAAWNGVATTWQARPVIEQQSAFNRALAERLARPPGAVLEVRLVEQDRHTTRLLREMALLDVRARRNAGQSGGRLRLAYFSPMPPSRSGIADYSADLLPHLARLADVTVFTDDPAAGGFDGPIRATGEFSAQRDAFDLPVYHMGNSDWHASIYDLLTRYPGVVVLHDYVLHHFIGYHTAGRGDWAAYSRELAYERGSAGRGLARDVRAGRAAAPLFAAPLNRRALDSAVGVVVHSEYVAGLVQEAWVEEGSHVGLPLRVIPALMTVRPGRSRRTELGAPDDAVLFGVFGQLTAEKQIGAALRAFRGMRDRYPTARFLLVGEARPDVDAPALAAELGLVDSVYHVGFVADLDAFVDWIHTADVVVNLRQPTVGETSAVALRAMAAARPLIVFDHGWYGELPDAAALKTPPGDEDALRAAMERLAASAALRRAMGAAGREYVGRYCDPQHAAAAYVDFFHAVLTPGTVHG